MIAASASKRLRWKEWRQIAPLCVMLVICAALLHLFSMLINTLQPLSRDHMEVLSNNLLIGLPGLFAVGVGALLVGQEKDNKTLFWIESLPIAPKRLVGTKLLVGLVALVLMWIASCLLWGFLQDGVVRRTIHFEQAVSWPLHSLYLLLAGFGLAWKCRSSLAALLWLVPAALIPVVLALGVTILFDLQPANTVELFPSTNVLAICQVVCCVLAYVWCWRAGLAALAPTPAPKVTSAATRQATAKTVYLRPLGVNSALIWQSVKQNRWLFGASTAMLFLATAISGSPSWQGLAILLAFLAISWTAVSAFQGDQLQSRIRFMADRGVSPLKVWLTRHAAPVGLLVVVCAICLFFAVSGSYIDKLVAAASLIGIATITYITSQWIGQILNSPIIAGIIAPLASVGAAMLTSAGPVFLGAPIWLTGICVLLLVFATASLTRRWMDGKRDMVFWLTHGLAAGLFVLLPTIPVLLTLLSLSLTPRAWPEAELEKILAVQPRSGTYSLPISLDLPEDQLPPSIRELSGPERRFAAIEMQIGKIVDRGAQLQGGTDAYLVSQIELFRMHLEAGKTAQYQASYRQHVALTLRVVDQLRQSQALSSQEQADALEIFLTRQLVDSNAELYLGDSLYRRACSKVGNREFRQDCRRSAIKHALRIYHRETAVTDAYFFGGFAIDSENLGLGLNQKLKRNRRVEDMAYQLWQLSDRTASDYSTQLAALAKFFDVPPVQYGLGAQGEFFRINDVANALVSPSTVGARTPGHQWNAGWEETAAQLAEKIRSDANAVEDTEEGDIDTANEATRADDTDANDSNPDGEDGAAKE